MYECRRNAVTVKMAVSDGNIDQSTDVRLPYGQNDRNSNEYSLKSFCNGHLDRYALLSEHEKDDVKVVRPDSPASTFILVCMAPESGRAHILH
jgi:hypothetical protein